MKFKSRIVSLILVLAVSLGLLSGCSLVTTDVDKDMALKIATVSLDNDLSDDIYKRELVSLYNNNAQYNQYSGKTKKELYEYYLENLAQNRIIVQQSVKALTSTTKEPGNTEKSYFAQAAEKADANRTSIEKVLTTANKDGKAMTEVNYSGYKTDSVAAKNKILEAFLTEYEYYAARYNVLTAVNSLIDQFKEDEKETEEEAYEKFTFTGRTTLTVPSDKSGNEYELKTDDEIKTITTAYKKKMSRIIADNELKDEGGEPLFANGADLPSNKYDYNLAIYKAYNKKYSTGAVYTGASKKALSKLIRQLKKVGYLKSGEGNSVPENAEGILKLSFFESMVRSEYESAVVNKYKLALENQKINELNRDDSVDTMYAEYSTLFNSQKSKFYNGHTDYESALTDGSTFIVYNPKWSDGNYGYILNLLIPFGEAEKELITAFSSTKHDKGEETEYRKKFLAGVTAKDLRYSWVYQNYGTYAEDGERFTFGDDYVKNKDNEFLNHFNGTIKGATSYKYKDSDGDEQTAYLYDSVTPTEIPFNVFFDNLKNVMSFDAVTETDAATGAITGANGKITASDISEVKGDEVLLNDKYLELFRDYIYAFSGDDGSLKEDYGYMYSPFTSSTKYVTEYAEAAKRLINKGVGHYEVVVTDYGYHIMLCAKVINPTAGGTMMTKEAFRSSLETEGSTAKLFKEYKLETITSSSINEITTAFINRNMDKGVTYYKKAYEDLLKS